MRLRDAITRFKRMSNTILLIHGALKRLPSAGIEHLPPAGMEQPSFPTSTGLLQADKSDPTLE